MTFSLRFDRWREGGGRNSASGLGRAWVGVGGGGRRKMVVL